MTNLKDCEFQFKKDHLLDPKKFDKYGNSTSYKLWDLLTDLDQWEQIMRILANRNKRYPCDRAIYIHAANAYGHAFDIVCLAFNLFPDEKEDKERKKKYRDYKKKEKRVRLYKNKYWLIEKYSIGGMKIAEIAELCKVTPSTVRRHIKLLGIKKGRKDGQRRETNTPACEGS